MIPPFLEHTTCCWPYNTDVSVTCDTCYVSRVTVWCDEHYLPWGWRQPEPLSGREHIHGLPGFRTERPWDPGSELHCMAAQSGDTCVLMLHCIIGPTGSIMNTSTRQVTRAPCISLSRHTIMNFQTGKRYKTIRHCWFLHTPYKRIGSIIISKPHFQGVNV